MPKVVAKKDVRTRGGLVIALKGDTGMAIKPPSPAEPINWNKVLVRWRGCTRRYWVWPGDLAFERGIKPADFVAVPHCFDRYSQPPLPRGDGYSYNFGMNLRIIRESRALSQAKLGELMGAHINGDALAQSTIAYRERCAYSPNGTFTDAAAKALDVMPFVFFLPLDKCDVFPTARRFLRSFESSICK
jgi:hypothetical protein